MQEQNKVASEAPEVVPEKVRIYYVDWIRALAIHLVVYIHCLNIATELYELRG